MYRKFCISFFTLPNSQHYFNFFVYIFFSFPFVKIDIHFVMRRTYTCRKKVHLVLLRRWQNKFTISSYTSFVSFLLSQLIFISSSGEPTPAEKFPLGLTSPMAKQIHNFFMYIFCFFPFVTINIHFLIRQTYMCKKNSTWSYFAYGKKNLQFLEVHLPFLYPFFEMNLFLLMQ